MDYYFGDFTSGIMITTELSKPVTRKNIEDYLELTGDLFPVHSDQDYARRMGLRDMMVPGNFVVALSAGLLFRRGHLSNLLSQGEKKVRFVSPLYPDDSFYLVDTICRVEDKPQKNYGLIFIHRATFNHDGRLISNTDQSYFILKDSISTAVLKR